METSFKLILEDCEPYLKCLRNCEKGSLLVRGGEFEIDSIREFSHDLDNRKPVKSPQHLHDKVNELFATKFGWKIRNGVFCYGINLTRNTDTPSLGYGTQFLFFPIGDFDFVYSKEHFDLYKFFSTELKNEDDLEKLIFYNDSLCLAIKNVEPDEAYSNEISVKVSKYYLVNTKFISSIIRLVWG